MRGPFAKYYEPYAEYCLRSTLSAAELAAALEKECPASIWGYLFGIPASIGAAFGGKVRFRLKPGGELVLAPILGTRNSLRGDVAIRCESASGGGTVLHIVIAPSRTLCWFPYFYCGFALLMGGCATYAGLWWGLLVSAGFVGFCFLAAEICRAVGSDEVSKIKPAFEELLRKLEEKYPPAHEGGGK